MMSRMSPLLQITATLTIRVDHSLQLVVDQVVRVAAFVLMEAVVLDREPLVLRTAHILVTRGDLPSTMEDPMDREAQVIPTALILETREGLPTLLVDLMDSEGLLSMITAANPMVRMDLPPMVALDHMVRIHLPWELVNLITVIPPHHLTTVRVNGSHILLELVNMADMVRLPQEAASMEDRVHLPQVGAIMEDRAFLQEAANQVDRVDVIVLVGARALLEEATTTVDRVHLILEAVSMEDRDLTQEAASMLGRAHHILEANNMVNQDPQEALILGSSNHLPQGAVK